MEMETTIMTDRMILVRGGGDLATGVIHKLHQSTDLCAGRSRGSGCRGTDRDIT